MSIFSPGNVSHICKTTIDAMGLGIYSKSIFTNAIVEHKIIEATTQISK